jgi:dGTPase
VCHDFEDAVAVGIVQPDELPANVRELCGDTRQRQLSAFIRSMLRATATTGRIGMEPDVADALAAFRRFNYERVYLRAASRDQALRVVDLLRALVDHYIDHPHLLAENDDLGRGSPGAVAVPGSSDAVRASVAYVAGMTDRYACRQGITLLDYPLHKLPRGFDI